MEELLSLIKKEENADRLFTDPMFDTTQTWVWSADKQQIKGERSADSAWSLNFDFGDVSWLNLGRSIYVRGFRS